MWLRGFNGTSSESEYQWPEGYVTPTSHLWIVDGETFAWSTSKKRKPVCSLVSIMHWDPVADQAPSGISTLLLHALLVLFPHRENIIYYNEK